MRRLQDNPTVEISMNERFIFNIVSGASVMNVAGQDGDIYPALPMLSESSEFSLPQDSLRGMIEKTQFAIAVDDAREVLTGALLEISGGDATMVALDGFRMAYKREKVSDVMDVILSLIHIYSPGATLRAAVKRMTPSLSGASRMERPTHIPSSAPSQSTSQLWATRAVFSSREMPCCSVISSSRRRLSLIHI